MRDSRAPSVSSGNRLGVKQEIYGYPRQVTVRGRVEHGAARVTAKLRSRAAAVPATAVETDGGVHNVRVFNNRGVNAFHGGYSSQPTFGGPIYFIRNILIVNFYFQFLVPFRVVFCGL